jgi:hypothetical protein
MMSKSKIKYIFQIPTTIPARKLLVHNLISHNQKTVPGTNGFRAWFDERPDDYMVCSCGWAPHLGPHYCETAVDLDPDQLN